MGALYPNNQFIAVDGSSAAPSFRFQAEATTGWYRAATNTIATANIIQAAGTFTDSTGPSQVNIVPSVYFTSAASSATVNGIFTSLETGTANNKNWTNAFTGGGASAAATLRFRSTGSASGTITGVSAVMTDFSGNASTLTVTSFANFLAQMTVHAGAMTNKYGVYIANANLGSGGTITNQYGLYVEALSGAATLNDAIYVAGGRTYLGDIVVVANNKYIYGRNTANSANVGLICIDNTDQVIINPGGGNTVLFSGTTNKFAGNMFVPRQDGASQTSVGLLADSGVPSNANGSNGYIYFNAAGGAGTTIYQKRAGAWVGIV